MLRKSIIAFALTTGLSGALQAQNHEWHDGCFNEGCRSGNHKDDGKLPWSEIVSIAGITATALVSYYAQRKATENAQNQTETQRRIALSQIRATTISASRQKWNDRLRELSGEFLPIAIQLSLGRFDDDEGKRKLEVERLLELTIQIQLLVTGESVDENRLRALLQDIYQQADLSTERERTNLMRFLHERIAELRDLTRKVIHDEWKRIDAEIDG